MALWVKGKLMGLNRCLDPITFALAQCPRGPRNRHTQRRRQRELLYNDAVLTDSWGQEQGLDEDGCFAPLLQWVRRKRSPGLNLAAACCASGLSLCRLQCRCLGAD